MRLIWNDIYPSTIGVVAESDFLIGILPKTFCTICRTVPWAMICTSFDFESKKILYVVLIALSRMAPCKEKTGSAFVSAACKAYVIARKILITSQRNDPHLYDL